MRSDQESKGVLYSYLITAFIMGRNGSEISNLSFLIKYEIWKGDLYLGMVGSL